MEEIDLIFAKGYVENMTYVRAAKELPRLTDDQVEAMNNEYGIGVSDSSEEGEKPTVEHRSPRAQH